MATDIIARGMAAGVVSQVLADKQAVSEDREAVEAAKTEVLNVAESIPEDYSTLSADVSELKEDLSGLEDTHGLFPYKLIKGFMQSTGVSNGSDAYRSLICDIILDKTKTYRYKGEGRSAAYSCVFYNSENTVISAIQISSTSYVDVEIPDNAVRARFASFANYSQPGDEKRIVFGVTVSGGIEDKISDLSDRINTTNSNIDNKVSDEKSVYFSSNNKNIFNPDYYQPGYLNVTNGNIIASTSYRTSWFINLSQFTNGISISGRSRFVVFFDSDKKYLTGVNLPSGIQQEAYIATKTYINSINAKYLRFTYYIDALPQIEDNTEVTSYIAPDYTSEIVSTISSDVSDSKSIEYFSNFFVPNEDTFLETDLTDTYGYMATNGTVYSAGNTSYNYAPVSVEKGKTYIIHSVLYKLITPFVFVGGGKVIKSMDETSDSTITKYTLKFTPPTNGIVYINFYHEPIWIAEVESVSDFGKLKDECIPNSILSKISEISSIGNALHQKKWAVCGDSFSNGDFSGSTEPHTITDGKYAGMNAVYGYLIGNRNDMTIQHMAQGGKTLATPEGSQFTNCFSNPDSPQGYTNIAEDVDYITIYLGINDSHHRPNSSGSDGEDTTGVIPLGTPTDSTIRTFYGAWNVVLPWLIENRPFAHIGIIVSNGCETDEYRQATIAMANKYGIPYIDLNGDERTPMLMRSTNTNVSSTIRALRTNAMKVSDTNGHPNVKCHEYESWIIENFLRTL